MAKGDKRLERIRNDLLEWGRYRGSKEGSKPACARQRANLYFLTSTVKEMEMEGPENT